MVEVVLPTPPLALTTVTTTASTPCAPGRRIAVVTNNDDAYRTALAALDAGLEVPVVLDARPRAEGALPPPRKKSRRR